MCKHAHYKRAHFPNSCPCPMELQSGFFHDMVKACAQAVQRLWILVLVVKIPLEFVSIYPRTTWKYSTGLKTPSPVLFSSPSSSSSEALIQIAPTTFNFGLFLMCQFKSLSQAALGQCSGIGASAWEQKWCKVLLWQQHHGDNFAHLGRCGVGWFMPQKACWHFGMCEGDTASSLCFVSLITLKTSPACDMRCKISR